MAVLGEYPMKEYVGNTNAILRKWIEMTNSKVYCYDCFNAFLIIEYIYRLNPSSLYLTKYLALTYLLPLFSFPPLLL